MSDDKDEDCDVLWLLERLKEITSVLHVKAIKRVDLINTILEMARMYLVREESENDFMKRFKASIDTVIAAGDRNIFQRRYNC